MSKFCGNCGAQLEDEARVCGYCGTVLNSTPFNNGDVKNVPGIVSESDKEKTEKLKKHLKLGGVIAVLVIVLIIAVKVISSYTGYNGLVNKIMKAYKNYDIASVVAVSSEYYDCFPDGVDESYFTREIGNTLDDFEERVGHKYKISYEITDSYQMSERKFEELLEDISWYTDDYDESIIDKVMIVEVKITAKEGNESLLKTLDLTLIKERGSWKVLYIE